MYIRKLRFLNKFSFNPLYNFAMVIPFFGILFQTNYLSQIGGLSVPDNTRKVLSTLLTTKLAKQVTMHGSSKKYSFKDMHLKDILIGKISLMFEGL